MYYYCKLNIAECDRNRYTETFKCLGVTIASNVKQARRKHTLKQVQYWRFRPVHLPVKSKNSSYFDQSLSLFSPAKKNIPVNGNF